jgi:putative transposon-encoded protein
MADQVDETGSDGDVSDVGDPELVRTRRKLLAARREIHDKDRRLKEHIAVAARHSVTASGAAAKVTIDLVEANPSIWL